MCGRIRRKKSLFFRAPLAWTNNFRHFLGISTTHFNEQYQRVDAMKTNAADRQCRTLSSNWAQFSQMKWTNCQTNNKKIMLGGKNWPFYMSFLHLPITTTLCYWASHCSAQIFFIMLHKGWLWIMCSFNDRSESHNILLLCLYRSLFVAVVVVVVVDVDAIWMICKKQLRPFKHSLPF